MSDAARTNNTSERSASSLEPLFPRALRAFMNCLRSEREKVSMIDKLWRAALFVPVFGSYLIVARLLLWARRPIEVVRPMEWGPMLQCRPPDLVMMYVNLFGVWEPDVSRFIARRLTKNDTFIDVGANVGYYSLLAASIVEDGRVVAIEASPRIFARLTENIARNERLINVRAVHVAASSKEGELAIHLGPEHNLGLTTTSARSGYAAEAIVSAKPMHVILTEKEIAEARLVKIDVEGGEDEVLAGMAEFLERCRDDVEILVELTPRWWSGDERSPSGVLKMFFDAGFHAYQLNNNYWPWRYLWAREVKPPRRVRFDLKKDVRRLDLVLSRVDAEEL